MAYQCASNAENTILRAHFAYMAMRSGVTLERLIQVTDLTSVGGGASAAEDAAIAFAHAARCVVVLVSTGAVFVVVVVDGGGGDVMAVSFLSCSPITGGL